MAGSQRREPTAADLAGFKGLGIAVHQLRQEKGLTPAQLAEGAGLSGSTINAIERGKQNTTWSNLRRLAGGLGVDLEKLLDLGIDLAPGPGGDELRWDRSHAAQSE